MDKPKTLLHQKHSGTHTKHLPRMRTRFSNRGRTSILPTLRTSDTRLNSLCRRLSYSLPSRFKVRLNHLFRYFFIGLCYSGNTFFHFKTKTNLKPKLTLCCGMNTELFFFYITIDFYHFMKKLLVFRQPSKVATALHS